MFIAEQISANPFFGTVRSERHELQERQDAVRVEELFAENAAATRMCQKQVRTQARAPKRTDKRRCARIENACELKIRAYLRLYLREKSKGTSTRVQRREGPTFLSLLNESIGSKSKTRQKV